MVSITREDYDNLQQKYQLLESRLAQAELQNKWLMEKLHLSQKKRFGRSSEQAGEAVVGQLSFLFDEAEATDAKSLCVATSESKGKSHKRKRRSGSIDDVIPEGLPVEVVEHKLSDEELNCGICGAQMEIIGKEVRRTLVIEPPKFHERDDVYYTYACPACEKETDEANITKVQPEPSVLRGSFASGEAIAHIMTQKFVMYSPLYRQEQEFKRAGLKLSRQTMSNWVLHASDDWLRPVYDELRKELRARQVLHADETTLQVLHEPGKTAVSKSYMWLYRTGGDAERPIVLYEYQPNRKAENAEKFLEDFSGWLHADGYSGYHRLPERIRIVGCLAHARRKFDEALNLLPKEAQKGSKAAEGVAFFSHLFDQDDGFEDMTAQARHHKRLEQEKPVLDALFAWAKGLMSSTAPKSALGKALHYLQEQRPYLVRYLEDGRLEQSNNRAERSIKPFVMGRKNFLFANTPGGAQSSAVIYSLIETAKENGLDPYRYLLWIFKTAPKLSKTDTTWPAHLLPVLAPADCRCLK